MPILPRITKLATAAAAAVLGSSDMPMAQHPMKPNEMSMGGGGDETMIMPTHQEDGVLGSSDMPMEHPKEQNEMSMNGGEVTMITPTHQGDMAVDDVETPSMHSDHADPLVDDDTESFRRPIDPSFAGCGRTDVNASYHYGLINQRMHRGMAINYTESNEYNFLAGMIPHHTAAVDMCQVYLHEVETNENVEENAGIASLCYNITYGPKSWGVWQYDFSQPGETEQMMDVLEDIGMVEEYERGCSNMPSNEEHHRSLMATSTMDMAHGGEHHGDMFMGCGRLDLPEAKDYIAANMKMHGYMALNFTNDAAVDFLLGMIPHHEGAIQMCDIYYSHWRCPGRRPCWSAHPLNGIPTNLLTFDKTRDVLAAMKHICTDHIMSTQPKEVVWMKEELRRLSPDSLVMYEHMQQKGHYPCSSTESPMSDAMDQHEMHNGMADDMEGIMMEKNEVTDSMMMMEGDGQRRRRQLRSIKP